MWRQQYRPVLPAGHDIVLMCKSYVEGNFYLTLWSPKLMYVIHKSFLPTLQRPQRSRTSHFAALSCRGCLWNIFHYECRKNVVVFRMPNMMLNNAFWKTLSGLRPYTCVHLRGFLIVSLQSCWWKGTGLDYEYLGVFTGFTKRRIMKILYMVRLEYAICINILSGLVHAYVQLVITFCGPISFVLYKNVFSREITCFSKLYFHDNFQEPTLIGASIMSA